MRGLEDAPFAGPPMPAETRVVVPAATSRTNTSATPLVSPGTRDGEADTKATRLPSDESEAPFWAVVSFAGTPAVVTVTSDGGAAACALPAAAATRAAANPHARRLDARRNDDLQLSYVPAVTPSRRARAEACALGLTMGASESSG